MIELPEFIRTEVYHPLSVHFPITLLLVASLFKLVGIWIPTPTWRQGGSLLLALGVVGIWIAIYTGNLADGIVSRQICDPTVLKTHENNAYLTAWFFSGSLLLDLINRFDLLSGKILRILVVLVMLTGSGILVYVGHLGAELVYEQAAGVNVPSGDCAGF
ncbi:hypothetical protein MKO06_08810 [Gramella sp. GC03-9]|uniref:DUF2231 domain-containing protein n=1 Tax=Christiangramia oceanisediminis TaxID=2920386 RepID=A0A9X2I521_9FLAO|nr:DUF2231 domain-containing protein [Gramella oceanisediminis]MCP9200005.1 hypothetical protein [Gramella oceanisediminis]